MRDARFETGTQRGLEAGFEHAVALGFTPDRPVVECAIQEGQHLLDREFLTIGSQHGMSATLELQREEALAQQAPEALEARPGRHVRPEPQTQDPAAGIGDGIRIGG